VKDYCEEHNQSIAEFTEEALKKLIDEKGHDIKSLMKYVKGSALLSIYEETIRKEIEGAPRELIIDIVKLVKNNPNSRFYEISLDEDNGERLKEALSLGAKEIIMIAKVKPERDSKDKSEEELVDVVAKYSNEGFKIKVALKKDASIKNKPELLLFISYKKEGNDGK
jgi:hypothetical protein